MSGGGCLHTSYTSSNHILSGGRYLQSRKLAGKHVSDIQYIN